MNSGPNISSFGLPELVMMSVVGIIVLLPLIFALVALVSCLKSNFQDSTNKLIWVLVILFLPLIGSILYFVMSPKQRIQ